MKNINSDSYYQEIIDKIKNLILENNWNHALILVKDELKMPYIPNEQETILKLLQDEIENHLTINTKIKNRDWNLQEISKVLMNPFDEELHPMAFYYLQSQNVRLILSEIEKYLISKIFSNANKTELLFILKNQDINQDFKVVKTHGVFIVNPSKLIPWNDLSIYQAIVKLFEDEVYIDNPGIYHICLSLLESYIENLFPMIPNKNQAKPLAAALYIRACSLQFINVTLTYCSNKFQTTSTLIKKYVTIINEQQIT